jgi:ribonuclease HI
VNDDGIYTDGSARPNPGPGGWGALHVVRGQVIAISSGGEEHTTNNRMELAAIVAGLHLTPPQNAATPDTPTASTPATGTPATSRSVTIEPVTIEPVTIDPVTIEPVTIEPVTIYSDSSYAVQALTTWVHSWRRNGWQTRSGPVKNRDLLETALDVLRQRPHVRLQWVKGHAGHRWNEAADELANRARP